MTQLSEPDAVPERGPVTAALPPSRRFDLNDPSDPLVWKKPLRDTDWQLQSYAFDNATGDLYFAQLEPGTTNGNLWITRTDSDGERRDAMALRGFGHGVQIAVEPTGDGTVHLWTETHVADNGYGTRVGRFRFDAGATITSEQAQDRTPSLTDLRDNPQPAIDPYNDRLLVRFLDGAGRRRLVVYAMDDARAGRLGSDERLAECALPARGEWADDHPFQGFTAFGQYAYLLEGGASSPVSYLTCVDLNTGSVVGDRVETRAGKSLPTREPEGMAIQMLPDEVRLTLGLSSRSDGVYLASVFYKNAFV
jgi:hypothetical protein